MIKVNYLFKPQHCLDFEGKVLLPMCLVITFIEARGRRQSWDAEASHHANDSSFGNRGRKDNSRLGNQFSESDSAKRRGSNSSVDSR